MIEHFHPDDVPAHFAAAAAILRPGGSYVFTTPHAFLGPADLSRVLLLRRPHFMHLKEYTHRELGAIARRAGFRKVSAVYVPPMAVRRKIPFMFSSPLFYHYLSAMERLLDRVRLPRLLLRALLFHNDVFLVVTK